MTALVQRVLIFTMVLACATETFGSPPPITLQHLFDGESIALGNARFSNWELVSATATDETLPDFSQIEVLPNIDLVATRLDFFAHNQLSIAGANSLDLTFKFDVESLDPARPFSSHILEFTSLTQSADNSLVFISDELSAPPATDVATTLVISDETSSFVHEFDFANFAPRRAITMVTNIFASGLTDDDLVQLHSFGQSYFQSGPDLLAGDFNNDGEVDAADYTVWRDNLGAPAGTLFNDVDGVVVGLEQFATWKANFGRAGGGAVVAAPLPEPATAFLALLASLACGARVRFTS
jgi:hypothetical protein